jgi:hypothetical protein
MPSVAWANPATLLQKLHRQKQTVFMHCSNVYLAKSVLLLLTHLKSEECWKGQ